MAVYEQDPEDALDYTWDFSDLLPAGDTVQSATLSGPTPLVSTNLANPGQKVMAMLSFPTGVLGAYYRVKCSIVSAAGRRKDKTITVRMKDA